MQRSRGCYIPTSVRIGAEDSKACHPLWNYLKQVWPWLRMTLAVPRVWPVGAGVQQWAQVQSVCQTLSEQGPGSRLSLWGPPTRPPCVPVQPSARRTCSSPAAIDTKRMMGRPGDETEAQELEQFIRGCPAMSGQSQGLNQGVRLASGTFPTERQLTEAETKARLERTVSASKPGRGRRTVESAPSDQGQGRTLLPGPSRAGQRTTWPHSSAITSRRHCWVELCRPEKTG